ncbi:MAG: hypothetical protein IJW16_01690 [Clostridia bacterium]|nr:hypothetical protein [Clostridia bacterium]
MAEISVQFKNKFNGYDKAQVEEYIRVTESKLQETSTALAQSQEQIAELEARLTNLTNGEVAVEEKVELYDKLMKKMDGDYANLLAPAIAKAKAIEDKADAEYAIRMDQARYAAEGIYTETADRIVGVVDGAVNAKMDDLYNLIDEFLYRKTLAGRVKTFVEGCRVFSAKVVVAANEAKKLPGKAANKVKATYADAKVKVQKKLGTYKDEAVEADAE